MSLSELSRVTGYDVSTMRRKTRDMKSCVAIVDGKKVIFYRP